VGGEGAIHLPVLRAISEIVAGITPPIVVNQVVIFGFKSLLGQSHKPIRILGVR
jgi:hypothetical protein